MNRKIRVTFIYKDCTSLSEQNYYTQHRNLLLKALRRNDSIEMNYVLTSNIFYNEMKLTQRLDKIEQIPYIN